MPWHSWNATLLLLTVVLLVALNSMPAPTLSPWRNGVASAPTSYARHPPVHVHAPPAEPVVLAAPEVAEAQWPAEPEPDMQAERPEPKPEPAAAAATAWSEAPAPARRAVQPYVVLGVATAPRNRGHRTWIRETWMTLPNVVARTTLSFFVLGLLTKDGTTHDDETRQASEQPFRAALTLSLYTSRSPEPPEPSPERPAASWGERPLSCMSTCLCVRV